MIQLKSILVLLGLGCISISRGQSVDIKHVIELKQGGIEIEFQAREKDGHLGKATIDQIKLLADDKPTEAIRVEVGRRERPPGSYLFIAYGIGNESSEKDYWNVFLNSVKKFADSRRPDDQFKISFAGSKKATEYTTKADFIKSLSKGTYGWDSIEGSGNKPGSIQETIKQTISGEGSGKENLRVIFVQGEKDNSSDSNLSSDLIKQAKSRFQDFSFISLTSEDNSLLLQSLSEATKGCKFFPKSPSSLQWCLSRISDYYTDFQLLTAEKFPSDAHSAKLVWKSENNSDVSTDVTIPQGNSNSMTLKIALTLLTVTLSVTLVFCVYFIVKRTGKTIHTHSTITKTEEKIIVMEPVKRITQLDIAPDPIRAWLYCIDGPMLHTLLVMRAGEYESVIGRGLNASMRITDPSASESHARLRTHEDGTFSIGDMASSNGLFLNGARISNFPIKDNDLIQVGLSKFVFKCLSKKEMA
jgi:hypothetical protein